MKLNDLELIKEKAFQDINLRLYKEGYKVYVGASSCGISKGSRDVLEVILDEIADLALSNVTVTQMGCINECVYEPIVKVIDSSKQEYIYGNVTNEVAKEIVTSHLSGNKVVTKNLLNTLKG